MTVGIWIKTLSNILLLGPETQTIIATGSVMTGTAAGYVDDPRLAGGYPIIISVQPVAGASEIPPDLAFDVGLNRLSWSFDGAAVNHRIIYGIHC